MTQSQISADPFLSEWLENKYGCFLNAATRGRYSSVCASTMTIGPNEVYQGYSPYVIKAITTGEKDYKNGYCFLILYVASKSYIRFDAT
jgi:hypothetical protein